MEEEVEPRPPIGDAAESLKRSAAALRIAAARLRHAARVQMDAAAGWSELARRLRRAVETMHRLRRERSLEGEPTMTLDGKGEVRAARPAGRRFTYADYVELRGWEFEKFRVMAPITSDDIGGVDLEALAEALCSGSSETLAAGSSAGAGDITSGSD